MRRIDKNTILDCEKSFEEVRLSRVGTNNNNKESNAKSFEKLFGDLSNCIFVGELSLSDLNLNSLKGMPREVTGAVHINLNPWLKNLEYLSCEIADILSVEHCLALESLKGIENLHIKSRPEVDFFYNHIFLKNNPKLVDISYLSEDTVSNLNLLSLSNSPATLPEIVKTIAKKQAPLENLDFLASDFPEKELEKIYSIYEKLDFDSEKFDRAIELL